jgi:hypothetical protein
VFSPGHLREVPLLAFPNQVFYQLSTGDRIVSTDSKSRNLEQALDILTFVSTHWNSGVPANHLIG